MLLHLAPNVVNRKRAPLSFAKTPHEAILVHVTCYAVSSYVIDFTCALDFGEAQAKLAESSIKMVRFRCSWILARSLLRIADFSSKRNCVGKHMPT